VVSGNEALVAGPNTISVAVTAADGTLRTYTVTVTVKTLSSVKTLSTFTVAGTSVTNGATVVVLPGTTSVAVIATATSAAATVAVSGATGLVDGNNTITVTVTAEDGTTTTYTVTVSVRALSSVKTLSGITVNGVTVIAGSTTELAAGTQRATVVATATDAAATAAVSGNTSLVAGNNTVTITVTAEDGTTASYTITLKVLVLSSVKTLSSLSIAGTTVANGSTVSLPAGSKSVTVLATPTDSKATVAITGNTALNAGNNTVTVTVTAEDGTTATYTVTIVVSAFSSNKTLAVFTVNGTTVADLGSVVLTPGTTAVEVVATPEDSAATVAITGRSGLVGGVNTLTVVVTAADGSTKTYTVTLSVTVLSSNTALSTFTVNGGAVVDNSRVTLAPGTTRVTVVAVTQDQDASVVVAGNTGLVAGDNYLTATVTAADGTVKVYHVTITVSPANGTGLSTFTINGTAVVDGDSINVAVGTSSVTVVATPTDASLGATASVAGNTGLVGGNNNVVVTVTAGDGVTTQTYTVRVVVAQLSSVKTLSTFTVNGAATTNGATINLPAGTTSVSVVAIATDAGATAVVSGRSGLVGGNNTLSVLVTAADGSTATYTVTLNVAVLSSVKTLATFTVNGSATTNGATIDLPAGTTSVSVVATPTDAGATASVAGATGLVSGNNSLVVTVTAANGTTATYTVTLNVAALSGDKSLAVFTVNGNAVVDGGSVSLPAGTTSVSVVATPTDSNAGATIAGRTGLVGGANSLVVTVTAANGTTATYTVTLNVAVLSTVKTLSLFTVNGSAVTSGATVELAAGTAAVTVVATPTSSAASVAINGRTGLVTGNNTLSVVVTAEDGTTATYTVTLKVLALSNDTSISSITINDVDRVSVGGTYYVDPGIATVNTIRVVTTQATAQVVVTGANALVNGNNTVNIRVTAPDGTVANYQFTIVVSLLSSDATLRTLTINGQQIIVNGVRLINTKITVNATAALDGLDIIATQNEPATDLIIDGDASLIAGIDNTVTFSLTAPDGTAKIYTVVVHVKGDTSIQSIDVAAGDLFDTIDVGGVFEVPFGTKNISVTVTLNDDSAKKITVVKPALVAGNNTISVTVIARDDTTATYTFTVKVLRDTSLKVFKVGLITVVDGDSVDVPYGTKSVVLTTTATDATSVVTVRGNANFVTGPNDVIVKVTATDGSFAEYTVTVMVADPSDDNSLDVLTLNGNDVMDGDEITLPKGVTSVTIVATPTESHARAVISGNTGLKAGANNVVIRVTAENGDVAVNTIVVTIAANNDEWLLVDSDPATAFGAVAATLDGEDAPAALASTAAQLVANGTGWSVNWNPFWLNAKATTLDATKRLVLAQGGSAVFNGTGFAPNSEARVYLGTLLLGTFTASAGGAITGTVAISATQAVGNYTLTITGFDTKFLARWVSVGMNVKVGYLTKVYTVVFKTTASAVDAAAAKILAAIPTLVKGAGSILIDIKGWAAGAKISTTLTKLGTTRATNIKTSLTKLKVVATYTVGFGALEKATSKTSKGVITVKYAKP
jgi:hypothetical protein